MKFKTLIASVAFFALGTAVAGAHRQTLGGDG